MRVRLLLATLLLAVSGFAAERGEEILLWPQGAPGSEGMTSPEVVQGPDNAKNFKRISNINKPSILVFLPPKEKNTGMGVVVAPGGAHQFLVIEKEGYEIADWLNQHGIAAFVLKYRLARSPGSKYTVEGNALPDANRSIRLVRSHAKEWGVDPSKIGFMGFSAGGEVAALAETRFDAGKADAADPIDRCSSRPDFAVVVYPGFRPGSVTVPKDAPPTFLVCADDDRSHVTATVELYSGLEKQGVSSEMHIYASGGHGFGIRDVHAPVSTWDERLLEWMVDKKLLAKQ
jgi:acetyl esterase/lipase